MCFASQYSAAGGAPVFGSIRLSLTPHLERHTGSAGEVSELKFAEWIAGTSDRGAPAPKCECCKPPVLDAKTRACGRYMVRGPKLGKCVCRQLGRGAGNRLHVTLWGKAQELPNIDPITRRDFGWDFFHRRQ